MTGVQTCALPICGNVIRYKLGKDGKAELIKQDFKNIEAGDGVKIKLSNSAVAKLIDSISKFEKIRSEGGITTGVQKYSLVGQNDLVISDENVAKVVQSMLENDAVAHFWSTLSSESPDTATALADSRIQHYTVLKQEGFVKVDRRRGAVIAIDIDKLHAMSEMMRELKVILAKGRLKDISREEVHEMIDEIYNEYGGQ